MGDSWENSWEKSWIWAIHGIGFNPRHGKIIGPYWITDGFNQSNYLTINKCTTDLCSRSFCPLCFPTFSHHRHPRHPNSFSSYFPAAAQRTGTSGGHSVDSVDSTASAKMEIALIHVDICWHMLIYVDMCWYLLIYVDMCWYNSQTSN